MTIFIKNAYYLHIYNFNYKYNYENINEYNIPVLWKQYRDVDRLWTLCTLKENYWLCTQLLVI